MRYPDKGPITAGGAFAVPAGIGVVPAIPPSSGSRTDYRRPSFRVNSGGTDGTASLDRPAGRLNMKTVEARQRIPPRISSPAQVHRRSTPDL
jgi:hypothetical protein